MPDFYVAMVCFHQTNAFLRPYQWFSLTKPMVFSEQTYGFVDKNHSLSSTKPMPYF